MQRNARFGFMRYSQGNGPGPAVGHRDPASRHHCHIRLVLVTIEDLMAMNYKIQITTLENYVLGANKKMGLKIYQSIISAIDLSNLHQIYVQLGCGTIHTI